MPVFVSLNNKELKATSSRTPPLKNIYLNNKELKDSGITFSAEG